MQQSVRYLRLRARFGGVEILAPHPDTEQQSRQDRDQDQKPDFITVSENPDYCQTKKCNRKMGAKIGECIECRMQKPPKADCNCCNQPDNCQQYQ